MNHSIPRKHNNQFTISTNQKYTHKSHLDSGLKHDLNQETKQFTLGSFLWAIFGSIISTPLTTKIARNVDLGDRCFPTYKNNLHFLFYITTIAYKHRVYTQTTFGMSTIYLSQWELDLHQIIRILRNKVSYMVEDPVSWTIQMRVWYGALTVRSCKLKLCRFYIPSMDVLGLTNSTTELLGWPAKVKSEEDTVCSLWKLEIYISFHFKPPNLVKISNCVEPIHTHNKSILYEVPPYSCAFVMHGKC
jgi:hypothetical protein